MRKSYLGLRGITNIPPTFYQATFASSQLSMLKQDKIGIHNGRHWYFMYRKTKNIRHSKLMGCLSYVSGLNCIAY